MGTRYLSQLGFSCNVYTFTFIMKKKKKDLIQLITYLLPLTVSTRAKLQKLHRLKGEPLRYVNIVGPGSGIAAILYLVNLSRILTLQISDLFLDFERVAAKNLGEFLNSPFPLGPIAITTSVPIPKDASLLILAQ